MAKKSKGLEMSRERTVVQAAGCSSLQSFIDLVGMLIFDESNIHPS